MNTGFSKKMLATTLFVGAASFLPAAAHAAFFKHNPHFGGTYRIDADHSLAWFEIGHANVSIFVGRFDKISGTYVLHPKDPSRDKVEITIPVASIDTNLPLRDQHLRGPEFFDAKKYPLIRFVSTRYVPTGQWTGDLYGKLSMHGVTRKVMFKVRQTGSADIGWLPKPWGGYLTGFTATTTIKRSNFGIDAFLGGISNRVKLNVNIEGIRVK